MFFACDINSYGFRSCAENCCQYQPSSYGEDCCIAKLNMVGKVEIGPYCPMKNVSLNEVEKDMLIRMGDLNLLRDIEVRK